MRLRNRHLNLRPPRVAETLEPRLPMSAAPDGPELTGDISEAAWVKRLYLDLLGRPASDAEAQYWIDTLQDGVAKTTVATVLLNCRERRSAIIDDYYEQVLGRTVDPAGLEFWLHVWDMTGGPEVVRASLIGSGEFFQNSGGTNSGAIQALYNDLLHRTAVESELNYWLPVVAKAPLANVALGFLTSDEFRLEMIDNWYHDYLHRDIDAGGGPYWVQRMRSGLSQAQIQAGLLSGVEYVSQPYFDIRDFGATANNTSNDSGAIQAAFNAADSAGNSTVFIPSGTFIIDNVRVFGDHLKIVGPGTLKLANNSAQVGALTIDGNHNVVAHLRVDGNKNSQHTGRAEGLRIVGQHNRVFRVEVTSTRYDPNTEAVGINFMVSGDYNRLVETRSVDAGYTGYRQIGNHTLYRDIVGINARIKGFNATGEGAGFTVDGAYFETNAGSHDLGPTSFQIDPGTGKVIDKVVLRNMTIRGPENVGPETSVAAKVVLVNDLLIENSSFTGAAANMNSLRFAEGMGRVTLRNVFLSRNLFMQQDTGLGGEDPMDELYMENVTIGDGVHAPAYSMEETEVGRLTMVNCRFVGFAVAGIDWHSANSEYTRIEVRNSVFQGRNNNHVTYDIQANDNGQLTNGNKLVWVNVNRTNSGGAGAAQM